MNHIKISIGTKEDIPALLKLIKELAEYELAPNEVAVSEDELLEDGFGANPIFGFYVAKQQGEVLGIALFYEKYSTWKGRCLFLEDIVVSQAHRNKGIGSMLFEQVCQLAKQKKVRRLEWQVLEWNEPAIQFYKKYNATLDAEWINGKLTGEQLEEGF